jgi:O-antigen/teichoic acid export membrane protein
VLFAGFSSAQRQGSQATSIAFAIAAALSILFAPVCITLALAGDDVVRLLLGERWLQAGPLIATLTWMCLFSPFSWISQTAMTTAGHLRSALAANIVASLVKIAALVTVTRLSADLHVIAVTIVVVVGIECLTFLALLYRGTRFDCRATLASLARAGFAGAVTYGVVAWISRSVVFDVHGVAASALHAAMVGSITVILFTALLIACWWGAGFPAGPEARLRDLLGELVAPVVSRYAVRFRLQR